MRKECSYVVLYKQKYCVGLRLFDKHGLNFNHLHANNNNNNNNNELKKFYRTFIVYRFIIVFG